MYTTTRNIAGGTLMKCTDCGHAISMNQICEKPLQSATDILKHMAAHYGSRAVTPVRVVTAPEMKVVASGESVSTLAAPETQWIASSLQSPN